MKLDKLRNYGKLQESYDQANQADADARYGDPCAEDEDIFFSEFSEKHGVYDDTDETFKSKDIPEGKYVEIINTNESVTGELIGRRDKNTVVHLQYYFYAGVRTRTQIFTSTVPGK